MLKSLYIKNILLIKSVEVDFARGLNIITGETGSGKSILLDCLSYCLSLKTGSIELLDKENKGSVIAEFNISDNKIVKNLLQEEEIEASDSIIFRRVVTTKGANKIFVNDEIVTAKLARKISRELVEMYGQHDFSNLLDKSNHIEIVDNIAEIENEIVAIEESYKNLKSLQKDLLNLNKKAEEAQKEEDYLKFVLNELEKLDVKPGEESELAEMRINLQQSQKLEETISSTLLELSSSNLSSAITSSSKSLIKLSGNLEGILKEKIDQVVEIIERAEIEINEASSSLEEISNEYEYSENKIDDVEERLFAIREAARKYRKNPDELHEYTQDVKEKLSLINGFDGKLQDLKNKLEIEKKEYLKKAEDISNKRKLASTKIEKKVHSELPKLNMKECRFKIEIERKEENNFSARGFDEITFKVSTNPGQDFTELSKTASGGELSRIMLALKLAVSEKKQNNSIVFDEIDTGISGATADLVGGRLKKLGDNVQVICITHQPQVASKAEQHLVVSKNTKSNNSEISVTTLNEKQANEEVARMLSGVNITDEARAAAERLKN